MNIRLLAGLERQAAVQTGTSTNVSMDARRLVIVGTSKTSMTINRQLQKCWTPRHTFADAGRSYRNKIHLDNSPLEPQSPSKNPSAQIAASLTAEMTCCVTARRSARASSKRMK